MATSTLTTPAADTLEAPAAIETLRKLADKIDRGPDEYETINKVSLAGTKGWKVEKYVPWWDGGKKLPKTQVFEVIGWNIFSVRDGVIKVEPITQEGVVFIDGYEFVSLVDPDGRYTIYEGGKVCEFETRAQWIAKEREDMIAWEARRVVATADKSRRSSVAAGGKRRS